MRKSYVHRFRPSFEPLERRVLPSTFTVINTANSGAGSLRRAISDANDNAGFDTILFNIPGGGVHTITPSSDLPKITGPVLIDATSQPSYAGTPLVEINGTNVGFDSAAFWITADGSTVQGFAINRTTTTWGIRIDGSDNTVRANFIGTDATGSAALPNSIGILIYSGTGNVIGGPDADDRNVISGNAFEGIKIADAVGNTVQGNFIGTDITGALPLGNAGVGVVVGTSTQDGYHIGTSSSETVIRGNVISGNAAGILILNPDSVDNLVVGNLIGTNAAGTAAIGNSSYGVGVANAPDNIIGGTASSDRNVISGNATGVVIVTESNAFWVDGIASGNAVLGNRIGTDIGGTAALGNVDGIVIQDSPDSFIGGNTASARNVISGNTQFGLQITGAGSTGNIVRGNFVGTNVAGKAGLGNGLDGIRIDGTATGNTIGGTAAGSRNVISANGRAGVHIAEVGTSGNAVQANRIGTNAAGNAKLGNAVGVLIDLGASGNLVGGTTASARNLLSGNKRTGVGIGGMNANDNVVQGNYIGTDITGNQPLGNSTAINIFRRASNNIIGGTVAGARNVIAGNAGTAIVIRDEFTSGNAVLGNYIGIGADGVTAMGQFQGITITGLADHNIVGGTDSGAGNVIAHSALEAVLVETGVGNAIRGNSMFNNNPGIVLLNNGNNNLPAPTITLVSNNSGNVTIDGTLTAAADTTYALDFFKSIVCHAFGFGEGEVYIGSLDTTTDGSGVANFSAEFAGEILPGRIVTATATDPDGNTSGFSACYTVVPIPPAPGPEVDTPAGLIAIASIDVFEPGASPSRQPFSSSGTTCDEQRGILQPVIEPRILTRKTDQNPRRLVIGCDHDSVLAGNENNVADPLSRPATLF